MVVFGLMIEVLLGRRLADGPPTMVMGAPHGTRLKYENLHRVCNKIRQMRRRDHFS
jgi:hypothetical protein